MTGPSSREIVERFARALHSMDLDELERVVADDVTDEYPQSGERIRGKANMRAVIENYPGSERRRVATDEIKVIGEEDHWVTTPDWRVLRIAGTGDQYTLTGKITYPDGSTWHVVQLVELRNGKVAKLISYFAEPFEAPAWRAPFVERDTTKV